MTEVEYQPTIFATGIAHDAARVGQTLNHAKRYELESHLEPMPIGVVAQLGETFDRPVMVHGLGTERDGHETLDLELGGGIKERIACPRPPGGRVLIMGG